LRDEHIRTFTPEIDTTTSYFRSTCRGRGRRILRLLRYDRSLVTIFKQRQNIRWFMGDAVHANERGCQIIDACSMLVQACSF
jgi:hypothetical protein